MDNNIEEVKKQSQYERYKELIKNYHLKTRDTHLIYMRNYAKQKRLEAHEIKEAKIKNDIIQEYLKGLIN